MYILKVKDHIDSAHFIKSYKGKCSRLHGHRWDIEVVLEGPTLNRMNILIDFKIVKELLKPIIEKLDHYSLNEVLKEDNVTAEFLSKWIFEEIEKYRIVECSSPLSPDLIEAVQRGVKLVRVEVWESPDCSISYPGEW